MISSHLKLLLDGGNNAPNLHSLLIHIGIIIICSLYSHHMWTYDFSVQDLGLFFFGIIKIRTQPTKERLGTQDDCRKSEETNMIEDKI